MQLRRRERNFWLARRFPQLCVLTARLTDESLVSFNMTSARNLRFLDREKEIVYPWTREGWSVGKSERENEKEQMI
jgi:hypothetical protein